MTGMAEARGMRRSAGAFEVFRVFLWLGLTSFGGPVAHLGYYRTELVERRRWLDEATYAHIVALCQFLPGPASSQTGMAIGLLRAGLPGAFAAWLGFTTPSALLMLAFAYGVAAFGDALGSGWLHGLKVVAVAVVAQAVWGMARSLAPDRERATIAIGAALVVLAWPTPFGQVAVIAAGGLIGRAFLRGTAESPGEPAGERLPIRVGHGLAVGCLAAFFLLLFALPALVGTADGHALALFDSFYRAGSLVFGGGHVVLPLLQAEVVPSGWVTNDEFLAGYGAAQAVPGPLFTFAAYLGAMARPEPNGALGALIATLAIFLPSFLLVVGALPYWERLRGRPAAQAALRGINAAVVGLLLAALYHPVWTAGILSPADFGLGLAAFAALAFWKVPPWLVVILGAAAGQAIAAI